CDNDDAGAGAGERAVGRVGGGDRLRARVLERGAGAGRAVGQRTVGRQQGGGVGAGEAGGAPVAGGRVVELVLGRHGKAEGAARGSTGWGADGEVGGGGGADRNGAVMCGAGAFFVD